MIIMPYERKDTLPLQFYIGTHGDATEIYVDINNASSYDGGVGETGFFEQAHDVDLGIFRHSELKDFVEHLKQTVNILERSK